MGSDGLLPLIALAACGVLVAAAIRRRGGFVANARSAAIWIVLFIGLAVALTVLEVG